MHVEVAQAVAHQVVGFDEGQDLLVGCGRTGAEGLEQFENLPAVLQIAACVSRRMARSHDGLSGHIVPTYMAPPPPPLSGSGRGREL